MNEYQQELVKEILSEVDKLNPPETNPHYERIKLLASILLGETKKEVPNGSLQL